MANFKDIVDIWEKIKDLANAKVTERPTVKRCEHNNTRFDYYGDENDEQEGAELVEICNDCGRVFRD